MKIIVLNCGSSSLKFQLIDMENEEVLCKGNFERIGGMKTTLKLNIRGEKSEELRIARDYDEAINYVLKVLQDPNNNLISSIDEIDAIGHRVVHGGEKFDKSVFITEDVIKEIEACIDLAPLHNPAAIAGIKAAQKVFSDKPMVAVFDTAFHQSMPPKAYIYQIPYRYYTSYKIRKYGFHGTSHRYVAHRVSELMNRDITNMKIITCHIGQGSSITAIDGGKSVDTSMGLTPLAGIPMATRCGDIDPAVVLKIMKLENYTVDEMDDLLNKKSGRIGFTGIGDFRLMKEAALNGSEDAILMRKMQSQRIKKYIGAYLAELNHVDAVVFTGGIMENNEDEIENAISNMEELGLELDLNKNKEMLRGEGLISKDSSKIKIYVIPTNEELEIANQTLEILNKEN